MAEENQPAQDTPPSEEDKERAKRYVGDKEDVKSMTFIPADELQKHQESINTRNPSD